MHDTVYCIEMRASNFNVIMIKLRRARQCAAINHIPMRAANCDELHHCNMRCARHCVQCH